MINTYKKFAIVAIFFLLIISIFSILIGSNCITAYENDNYKKNNYIPLTNEQILSINNKEKILVAVSVIPQAEFVEKIGMEKIITLSMIPLGSSHNYDPSPIQLKDLTKASLYIMLDSGEPFEEKYLKTFIELNSKMKIISSSINVKLIEINNVKDPHIWLSPKIAITMVENIYNGLVNIDPLNSDYYKKNKELYIQELKSLDIKIETILKNKKNKLFIIYHPSLSYFARDYNLKQIPIEIDGKEPTSKNIQNLITEAKINNIKIIFIQEQKNKKVVQSIADEINGTIVTLNPVSKDYIKNMEYIMNVIFKNME